MLGGEVKMLLRATYFLPIYLVVFAVGGFWEVYFPLFADNRKLTKGFSVTSILFALIVPPHYHYGRLLWVITFGVVIAWIFGGTGRNLSPVTPLAGRAFLFCLSAPNFR